MSPNLPGAFSAILRLSITSTLHPVPFILKKVYYSLIFRFLSSFRFFILPTILPSILSTILPSILSTILPSASPTPHITSDFRIFIILSQGHKGQHQRQQGQYQRYQGNRGVRGSKKAGRDACGDEKVGGREARSREAERRKDGKKVGMTGGMPAGRKKWEDGRQEGKKDGRQGAGRLKGAGRQASQAMLRQT